MALGEGTSVGSSWSRDEDIAFERALANYNDKTEIRWEEIATVVPGKTVEQIIEHYNILARDVMMIESGCVPLPDYDSSEESNPSASDDQELSLLECGNNRSCEFKQKDIPKPKQKRRRGIAWTSTEHRQFLLGLEEYGKGDWRSISRNCVVTRTPTQVASHAQKYFARLNSENKKRKRTSIHDITVAENDITSTKQRPITLQNRNVNLAATSNTQAIQTTSQPSLDLPMHGRPNIWNTQATQAISQPSLNRTTYGAPTIWNTQATAQAISQPSLNHSITYGAPTIWNTQATQAISQPSLNHSSTYGAPTIWNTQATQAISQPSLNHSSTYGAPTIWNTQATQAISQPPLNHSSTYGSAPTIWNTQGTSQLSANIPVYGTSSISQPMVGPMLSPFGTNMNRSVQPHMNSRVQQYSVPYYSGPSSAPINMDSIPCDIDLFN